MDRYGGDGSAAATLSFYWTARIVEGTPEPHDDVAEFRWFAPTEISDDDLCLTHTREVLAAVSAPLALTSAIIERGSRMELIGRIDAARERWNVLEHPFYKRWSCGELTRDELAHYAGEYRHAVVALADVRPRSRNTRSTRAKRPEHVWLWDEFASAAFGARIERRADPPRRPDA